MKNYILIFATLGFIASSCDWRSFDIVTSYSESGVYTIQETGSFNQSRTFTLTETLNALDLPDQSNIEEVYIKSISIIGQTLSGNEATAINIQGTLTYAGQTVNLFTSNNIPIANNQIAELNISNLNPAAITLLKNFFTAGIRSSFGLPFPGFNLTDQFIAVNVSGTASPSASSAINLQFDLSIAFDLTYSTCIETFPFVGDDC